MDKIKAIDPDDALSYDTIKLVKIRDRRLGIMHHLLQLGIFVYIIVYTIIVQQRYLKLEIPYGTIRATAQEPDTWQSADTLPYCAQYQAKLNNRTNYNCTYLLGLDLTYPPALMDSILVATRIKDTFYPVANPNCSTSSLPVTLDCAPNMNAGVATRYYTADIENYTLYFEHAIFGHQNNIATTNANLKGEFTYQTGYTEHLPSDPTLRDYFTLSQIIDAAGKPDLDVASGLTGSTGSLRYDGLLIITTVEYSNRVSNPKELKYDYKFYTIPDVNVISQEPTKPVAGGLSQRSWYGVRLVFLVIGSIGKFDFPTLLTSLVNGLVLVKVATTIVDLLILYIMPDKNIYKRHKFEVTEDFSDLRQQSKSELKPMGASNMGASNASQQDNSAMVS